MHLTHEELDLIKESLHFRLEKLRVKSYTCPSTEVLETLEALNALVYKITTEICRLTNTISE